MRNAGLHSVSKDESIAGMPASLVIRHLKDLRQLMSMEIDNLSGMIAALEHVSDINFEEGFDLHREVRQFESTLIRLALTKTHGNQVQAASLLKMKITTLNEKIKNHGIPRKPRKKRTLRTQISAVPQAR